MKLQEEISRIKTIMNICEEVTIYFAHPINTYNTELEIKSIESIKNKFPNSIILNPGDQQYQDGFKDYINSNPKEYMGYFRDLVNTCSIIVYLPFRDMKIGAGVRYEIYHLHQRFDNIYEIDPKNFSIRKVNMEYVNNNTLSIDETRRRIKEIMEIHNINFLFETIDPSEAYTDVGALETVIRGKRNIAALIDPPPPMRYLIHKNGLKLIKIKKNQYDLYLVYRPGSEEQVKELLSIADKYDGYFSYLATKEDTIRIGQLFGYSQDKIDQYVKERYK